MSRIDQRGQERRGGERRGEEGVKETGVNRLKERMEGMKKERAIHNKLVFNRRVFFNNNRGNSKVVCTWGTETAKQFEGKKG